jgi:hypothetical protein
MEGLGTWKGNPRNCNFVTVHLTQGYVERSIVTMLPRQKPDTKKQCKLPDYVFISKGCSKNFSKKAKYGITHRYDSVCGPMTKGMTLPVIVKLVRE